MRIGFLCGSFDPIHIGHIHMITSILNSGLIDKVVVIPTLQNPWKKNAPADFGKRVELIKIAIKPFGDKCEVSTVEEKVEGTNYSYKSCDLIREEYKNDELFIIAGTDVAKSIPNWKLYEERIKPYFRIIEITRDGYGENGNELTITGNNMEVSSTTIKQLINDKKITYPYLTEALLEKIKELNLYVIND